MSEIRPCRSCGRVHQERQRDPDNPRKGVTWADPEDGHPFRPPGWEDFARDRDEALEDIVGTWRAVRDSLAFAAPEAFELHLRRMDEAVADALS